MSVSQVLTLLAMAFLLAWVRGQTWLMGFLSTEHAGVWQEKLEQLENGLFPGSAMGAERSTLGYESHIFGVKDCYGCGDSVVCK